MKHYAGNDLPSQLRQTREADSELTEDETGKDRADDPAESAEDVVLRHGLLRRHDVDRIRVLSGCIVVSVFGHDWFPSLG